jgi:hypothetical protein
MCAQEHTQAGHTNHTAGQHHHDDGCGPQCGAIADERNHYYTGKYMTARDFRDEQEYFLSRHRLHNRLMHGWGIVCGLMVEQHTNPECQDHVIVTSGIAIDCCGRELVLHKRTVFKVWEPPKQAEKTPAYGQTDVSTPAPSTTNPPAELQYLLYLHYEEEGIECVPALYAEDCSTKRFEPNRIHEVACLNVIPWDETTSKQHAGCWQGSGVNLQPCSKGCGAEEKQPEGCVDPYCPCSLGVPLALIMMRREDDGYRVEHIALDGRKMLSPPKEYLTHIVSINWPHGGSVSLRHLRETMRGRLEVSFDRKLLVPYRKGAPVPQVGAPYELADEQGDEAIGINRQTFAAQYVGAQDDLEFLRPDRNAPPQLEQDCLAVFTIRPDKLDPEDRGGNIAGNTIYVTLKCDFILDCNGNPVDGNYLRGQFPTGDGIVGGTFESWFRVTYD